MKTIPQIFIGGRRIGGATEVFDAYREGALQAALAASRVRYRDDIAVDPDGYLPGWLQPR